MIGYTLQLILSRLKCDPVPNSTKNPTHPPTSSLTNPPASESTPCGLPVEERRSQILAILSGDVSNVDSLVTPGNPQYDAVEWLIGQDDFLICPDDDKLIQRYVMAVFYFSTEGGNWFECSQIGGCEICQIGGCQGSINYLRPVHECEWFGSFCNADLCITEIVFELNNVAGSIPFELEQLNDLEVLSLEQGSITSSIPASLGTLSNLRILDLDFNTITGSIPEEIYGLIKLDELDLNNNRITGTLSPSIGDLSELRLLQVYENLMTGEIPEELGDIETLVIGEFYNNSFTGVMPVSVCQNRLPPAGTGSISGLTSDCWPNPVPQLQCDCCTGCAVF